MKTINFNEFVHKGKIGELIFEEDYLIPNEITYENVTDDVNARKSGYDFNTSAGKFEVKTNYKDDEYLILEDQENCNPTLSKISPGWMAKTKADFIVFVSNKTRTLIFLEYSDRFKHHYRHSISGTYPSIKNAISERNGRKWQSSYKKIPFSELSDFIRVYSKSGFTTLELDGILNNINLAP